MHVDLGRIPPIALAVLRFAEDQVHRVRGQVKRLLPPDDSLRYLIRTHRRIHAKADVAAIRRAHTVADEMHRGQWRKSGEPYITHPVAVAQILAELGMDSTTLVAALLHDTVEDTRYTIVDLRTEFGPEVSLLVDGVTKFDKAFHGDAAEAETIRKMIIAAGADVRVLVIKLADRLHNMRTLDARSLASRTRIARATEDVLIPLCGRLGIQALKRELEDAVLAAIYPQEHAQILAWVAHRPEWTNYVDRFVKATEAALKAAKIPAKVLSRPRHLYSIWEQTQERGQLEPFELPRIEIIVSSEADCYPAIGVIHSCWRPVVSKFRDFIASPKNNLYRSLHTAVLGPEGRAVKIFIRTEEMARTAEYGVAAAFRYSRAGAHKLRRRARAGLRSGDQLDWLRHMIEWQQAAVEPGRFIESLRCDLSEGQLHVFVDGARLQLPANATPVDVAYALGPMVGDRCIAATVNGQLAFLSSPLADGDVVEIHTAGPQTSTDDAGRPIGPDPEWLSFVRTPLAQLQIEQRLRAIASPNGADLDSPPLGFLTRVRIGRSAIMLELRRRGRVMASELPLLALADHLGHPDIESLLVTVADHRVGAAEIAQLLIEHVDGAATAAMSAYAEVGTTRRP